MDTFAQGIAHTPSIWPTCRVATRLPSGTGKSLHELSATGKVAAFWSSSPPVATSLTGPSRIPECPSAWELTPITSPDSLKTVPSSSRSSTVAVTTLVLGRRYRLRLATLGFLQLDFSLRGRFARVAKRRLSDALRDKSCAVVPPSL